MSTLANTSPIDLVGMAARIVRDDEGVDALDLAARVEVTAGDLVDLALSLEQIVGEAMGAPAQQLHIEL